VLKPEFLVTMDSRIICFTADFVLGILSP